MLDSICKNKLMGGGGTILDFMNKLPVGLLMVLIVENIFLAFLCRQNTLLSLKFPQDIDTHSFFYLFLSYIMT